MLVIPKEPPLLENLNTYYLDVRRLIEHYQGEIGAGGVFFKSPTSEGILFFDPEEILNGCFKDKRSELNGSDAVETLLEAGTQANYSVTIYQVPAEEVYFWASLNTAERVYKDLSTEFTDMEGLIKKMRTEKFTGFIDVSIRAEDEGGLVFISNGEIIGGSFSSPPLQGQTDKQRLQSLLDKTKETGGLLQVSRIPALSQGDHYSPPTDVIKMIEEFLGVFETLCRSVKIKHLNFNNLLKKKFVDIADQYAFLDPFAAEFEYKDRQVTFNGDAEDQKLAEGVVFAVKELAEEMGLSTELNNYLSNWKKKYDRTLSDYGLRF